METSAQKGRLLIRNLEDAGFPHAEIQRFLQLEREGKWQEQLEFLSRHRTTLLDRLHLSQRQIDCLDYLAYQINSQHEQTSTKKKKILNGGF